MYWFCHTSTWICHRYTRVPHPEPSSLLPPHTIPLGCPSAPAPSIQYRASNLPFSICSIWPLLLFCSLYAFSEWLNILSILKKQRHHITDKVLNSQSYGFSRSHIWMWELDHKEGWVPKNPCSRIAVLEKTLESPLDNKEIKPINPKGNQPWIFIGRTDAKAEAPILWPPDAKSRLTGKKTLMLGKTEGRRRWWQRWLDGITDSTDMSLSKLQEMGNTGKSGVLQSTGLHSQTLLSNWTTKRFNDLFYLVLLFTIYASFLND